MTERPSPGEQLAGIAGLALILTMFLFAWYGWPGPAGSALNGLDAFDAFDDWFNIILVFAAFGGIMLGLFGSGVARLPVSLSVITTVLAGLGTIVLVIYIISPPGPPNFGAGLVEGDLSREFGLFLGLVELIALTLGAYMTMQEEGVDFGSAADRLSGPGGGYQERGTEQHPQHQAPPPPPAQEPYQQQPPAQDPYQQPPPGPPPPPPGS